MSRETGPDHTIAESAPPEPAPPPLREDPPDKDPARLQRQTFVMVNDRGRMVLLVALCTLAGVGVGFGLATMAGVRAPCPTRLQPHQGDARAAFGLERTIPRVGRFGHRARGCDHRRVHIWDGDEGIHIWDGADGFALWTDDEE